MMKSMARVLAAWHGILSFGEQDLVKRETTQLTLVRPPNNTILPDQQPMPTVGEVKATMKAMRRGV